MLISFPTLISWGCNNRPDEVNMGKGLTLHRNVIFVGMQSTFCSKLAIQGGLNISVRGLTAEVREEILSKTTDTL